MPRQKFLLTEAAVSRLSDVERCHHSKETIPLSRCRGSADTEPLGFTGLGPSPGFVFGFGLGVSGSRLGLGLVS